MTGDDLDTPLGQTPPRKRAALPPYVAPALASVLGLCLTGFVAWTLFVSEPFGGEPIVVVPIEHATVPPPKAPEQAAKQQPAKTEPPTPVRAQAQAPSPAPAPADQAAPPGSKTITIIDGSSGRRQEVIVKDPQSEQRPLTDPRLTEPSRHGPIPKIGGDGARPADVYAKPRSSELKPNAPRIGIIVGGLGISTVRTSDALDKLPAPITFAFTPYAKDLDQWVTRASNTGHELVLQVSMEPFDYPDSDPGPQTLLTSLVPEQNIDRLHWFMSRFQGYVGIVNFMGSRFTATEQAFTPVLRDISHRGLIYLDDGNSPRSIASQLAGANKLAFAKADLIIDAAPTAPEIDAALARLEFLAQERGLAVGFASAYPISIDRIAQWAKKIEERGIVLVPLSGAVNKSKSS